MITAVLGFGFFLWHLKSSNEHTQCRLLNILNGYLSAVCMTFSPATFTRILLTQRSTTKIYYKDVPDDEILETEQMILRVTITHGLAVSVLFLLISFATVLNHFKPGLYLDISLKWRHKIAIPVMVISFILAEQTFQASCGNLDTTFKVSKCETLRLKTLVMIPATMTSFFCHIIVVVDDIWDWKNIYNAVRTFLRPDMVTPVNFGDIEMVDLSAPPGEELYNPAHSLDHHVEFVSLNTGFMTLFLFNMLLFLLSLMTTIFDVFIDPGLALLVAMAVTPIIWISRSKKMKDKLKKIFQK